jgi:drug/metabolite transporter (DMT)-like permease
VSPPARSRGVLGGIALVVAATACFATLDTLTKVSTATVPLLMALWFRYCFQAVATTLVMLPQRGWAIWHTRRPGQQVLRGVLLLGSSMLAFLSLKYLPVAEFTAIVSLSPLVITLLAATLLREPVSLLRWLLVIGGFVGAMVIIRPGHEQFSWVMLLPLGVLAGNVCFQLLTSRMVRTEDPLTMHLYTGWVGTLVSSLALPWVWQMLRPVEWLYLLVMGVCATAGHFMFILGYRRAPVATLGPYLYAQLGFAVLGGWLVFAHTPDAWSLLGMGMIAACGAAGAWLTLRENRSLRAAVLPATET